MGSPCEHDSRSWQKVKEATERLPPFSPVLHRLLATLEAAGYVQAGTQGEWLIGVRAFRVGSAFLSHRNLVVQAFAYLKRLMEDSGETANLAVVEGGQAVFVEQVQCRELMRMSAKLGARAPLHASGVGKAMLAAMDEHGVAAALGRLPLEQFTPHTGEAISVSPLTWSHATFVIVVVEYLQKLEALRRAT